MKEHNNDSNVDLSENMKATHIKIEPAWLQKDTSVDWLEIPILTEDHWTKTISEQTIIVNQKIIL